MRDLNKLALRLRKAARVRLFLDYDGTLAGFAETPDKIIPDPGLADLLSRFVDHTRFRVAVISGRRLSHIEKLLPIPGLLLAGTYGIELRTPAGDRINRLELAAVRPTLEQIKPLWENLVSNGKGFYLEDKGWSLAIHARFAQDDDAQTLLESARTLAGDMIDPRVYHLRDGHKFLEVAPILANKGQAVRYIQKHYPWPGAELVFVGDDDKDEDAFAVINDLGGTSIVVATPPRSTAATHRLESPPAVRAWLTGLLADTEV
nr:trehalose-phosphatase [Anaerolineae bacterium]